MNRNNLRLVEAPDPRPDPTDEPIAAEAAGLRPAVSSSSAGGFPWLIVGGAVLMGLLVLLWLSTRRVDSPEPAEIGASAGGSAVVSAAPPPPQDLLMAEAGGRSLYPATGAQPGPNGLSELPVTVDAPGVPAAPAAGSGYAPAPFFGPTPGFVASPGGTPAPAPDAAASRRNAPVLVVDLSRGVGTVPGAATGLAAAAAGQAIDPAGETPAQAGVRGAAAARTAAASLSNDERFAERVGSSEPERAQASMLRNPGYVVPEGAMIPAVLETALNSDLPGYARAVVSRDVRGFDGKTVLIPRGSRVIGQYRSGVAVGQSRAFIVWSRVLRPDGASVQIASSGADALGRAGLEGEVDRHFFRRFGGSALMSVITAGASAIVGRPSTQVVIGSGGQAGALASSVSSRDVPPTIKVAQGTPIRIFVGRDLDFSAVGGAPR